MMRICVALALLAVVACGCAHAAGLKVVGETAVPLDGREVTIPVPDRGVAEDYMVELEGVITCSLDGKQYTPAQAHDLKRGLVQLVAPGTQIGASGVITQFHWPRSTAPPPELVGAYIDVDTLVERYIVTPTEARESLSGEVVLRLYQERSSGGGLTAIVIAVVVFCFCALTIASLVAGSRRRAPMGDVERILKQIDTKQATALRAIDDERWDAGELGSQIKRLKTGAHELAGHIQTFRASSAQVNRDRLASEIADVERRMEQTDREELKTELQATLDAKQNVQGLLADTDANEARYVLRLQKIESALDAVVLQMADQDSRLADGKVDRKAMDALNAELKSLDEAIKELSVLDEAGAIAAR
ncbi:MAG TPA: hypothetical protein QGH10_22770 [Armatimonadota bacterium]|nr:hypothetical protein [Armatimonadota bacterium]